MVPPKNTSHHPATAAGTGLRLQSGTAIELGKKIDQGLAISAWNHLIVYSGLTSAELSDTVRVPLRTLSRRRKRGRFSADESDRLMRFSLIVEKAVDLFEGDRDGARDWLRTAQPALSGETPIHVAQNTVGAREVEDLIGRLEQGVYT